MGIILEEKTKRQFGYYSNELKPSSEKKVIWKCKECGIEVEKKYRLAKENNLCLNCSNKINANINIEQRSGNMKEWHTKHDHPLLNTHRPEHVKRAISNAHIGVPCLEGTKEKLRVKNAGIGNPFYGRKHTEKSLEKMKIAAKKNAKHGKECNLYGKQYHGRGDWYYCIDGSKVWMRSSWEVKFAHYLDKNNIDWLYEPKTFPIIYDNKDGTYTPDFYFIKTNKYIEIKGWWRDDAYIKFKAFNEQYSNIVIEVYDKNKLKELKIL